MKIVHVMNWYIPDMGYQENFLPAEQQKLGHDVYIITSDRVPLYQGFEKNVGKIVKNRIIGTGESKENEVTIYRLPTIFEAKNGGIVAFRGIGPKLSEIKPDIVHAHNPYNLATLASVFFCKKIGYKLFIDDHSNTQNYHLDSFLKKIYINLIKFFYNLYDRDVSGWMPVSEPAKKILQDNLKVSSNKIQIIPLGISTQRFFQSLDLRVKTREELSLKKDEFLLITSGKFDDTKDIDILIMAFSKVLSQNRNVKLLIIGNGPSIYMEKLKKIIKEHEIENFVFFKDFVKNRDLPGFYNAADIGIWPGTHTITAVESLATGLSVIIPNDDLSYKIIFDNQAALGFERKNIESLANSILFLMNNPDKKTTIMENALSLATNQLSWEIIAKETIILYS